MTDTWRNWARNQECRPAVVEHPASEDELVATRLRTQLAKVGLGERGTPWWEQTDSQRRDRWESALVELDALDD